jgi:hypothetical protein
MVEECKEFLALSEPARQTYLYYNQYLGEDNIINFPIVDEPFKELLDKHFIVQIDKEYILINNIYIYKYLSYILSLIDKNNINIYSLGGISLFERKEREKKGFSPPTVEEVKAYARESGHQIDAEKFVDYYASVGWKVGKGKAMKDWKASVRNWSRRDAEEREQGNRKRGVTHDEAWHDEFFEAALKRTLK